jgi:multidrug efflux system outer membrane protein
MKRFTSIACAALALAACAVGPDYKRPAVDVPPAYRWQPASGEPGSLGDLSWWDLYRDADLQQLLHTALTENLDVRIAAARVEQARAALGTTRLQMLPTITGAGGLTRQRVSAAETPTGTPRIGNSDEARVDVSYELDVWGRLRRLNEAARADLLSSQYAQTAVVVGLIGDVASSYFQLLTLDEQLRITRETVAGRERFVELTRAQHERGVVSGLDVSSAEAQLAVARAELPELERQAAQAEDQLSVLLGRNPGSIARSTTVAPLFPLVPAGLPSQLLDRRPDIRQAEQALVAANAQVGAAKAALFPTLSLTGSFGVISTELSRLFSGPAGAWSAGVGAALPLLDPQRSLYQLDLADAQKRAALLQYQKTVQNAFREVADALIAIQKSAELKRAQQDQVNALQRTDAIALARYRTGYASYFDVINADSQLFSAQLSLSNANLSALLATVQLYRALGGGWASSTAR